ncbi:MAG: ChaN family lipoprotein [Cytophagales bacterium]|uniref:ChaN family lipoprotein n=1 Tax=Cyclobacterium marinum TaxID=104 RepID=UPI0011ED8819|nr:ChaN family lipoprotein [Cyclobacterium marinum]MBI0398473.1 ChaN family lipoprotein [Cyclobacterium marinum]MBR9774480.1 ChaN family lipoprotein [Cytophagales bacterium]
MCFSITSLLFILLQVNLSHFPLKKESYSIIETETGDTLSLTSLVDKLTNAEVIIFGEEHNDSVGHVLQYELYKGLLEKNSSITLSMEMFERDVQLVMDEYLEGLITEKKLLEEGKVWSNYSAYAPLVNLAKEKKQQVIAANVPGRYANMVSRKGLASLNQLQRKARHLFAKIKTPEPEDPYLLKFNKAMGAHAHRMGPSVFHAQLLRDATMAESIFKNWRKDKKTKILHLTGRFHSDERLGTVAELKRMKPRLRVKTISCFVNDEKLTKEMELADFIILTKQLNPK